MKVGITLNGTVRALDESFKETYEMYRESLLKVTGETAETIDMSETPLEENSEFVLHRVVEDRERSLLELDLSKDPLLFTRKYEFFDEQDFEEFTYDNFAFEIFARAFLTYPEAMEDLNTLYNLMVSSNNSVTIVSQERNVSKQATLLFLAQNKFQCNNIKFLYNYSKIWEIYDVIITANPLIIATTPQNKTCIKISTDTNQDFKADFEFESIYEVIEWFKKVKNKIK